LAMLPVICILGKVSVPVVFWKLRKKWMIRQDLTAKMNWLTLFLCNFYQLLLEVTNRYRYRYWWCPGNFFSVSDSGMAMRVGIGIILIRKKPAMKSAWILRERR
jgi:hypothetical protein